MNVGRLLAAAVVATVVDAVYGFVVYGTLLLSRFEALPAVYRQGADSQAHTPYIFCGTLLAMIAAAYIYTKGYEGGSGVGEFILRVEFVGGVESGFNFRGREGVLADESEQEQERGQGRARSPLRAASVNRLTTVLRRRARSDALYLWLVCLHAFTSSSFFSAFSSRGMMAASSWEDLTGA